MVSWNSTCASLLFFNTPSSALPSWNVLFFLLSYIEREISFSPYAFVGRQRTYRTIPLVQHSKAFSGSFYASPQSVPLWNTDGAEVHIYMHVWCTHYFSSSKESKFHTFPTILDIKQNKKWVIFWNLLRTLTMSSNCHFSKFSTALCYNNCALTALFVFSHLYCLLSPYLVQVDCMTSCQ